MKEIRYYWSYGKHLLRGQLGAQSRLEMRGETDEDLSLYLKEGRWEMMSDLFIEELFT